MGEAFQNAAASGPLLLALAACALAGLVSFASPCIVPLVPGYLSYLSGLVGAEAPPATAAQAGAIRRSGRWRVVGAAALFVAGFTVVFLLMTMTVFGVASSIRLNAQMLERIGGVITIVMGLAFVGLVPWLQRDARFRPRQWTTIAGAPLLGGVFALGWTPCTGPTLAGILSVAAGSGADVPRGTALIAAYCAGLGIPFVVLALGSTMALRAVGWLRRNSRRIQVVGGILLIGVGIALVTGYWDVFVGHIRNEF
ncbi:cytochrome c biogenesis CcdA family protein, partial [Tsukamurella sp. 8F]|uniref:cytochrome c biogenesis CcdA family protein n=2 Tax=unclassified Tsukamurella TaxID=2633480 RepID=UPI0023BA1B1F